MNAANEFEKAFFKMIINSVYGKTMENVRKRVNVKLINNENNYLKVVSRPSFVSQKILDKNLVAVHKIKPVLLLNKPIYVGFSILELSKMIIYHWHYNYFVKKFDCSLLFTDTDTIWCMKLRVMIVYMMKFLGIRSCLILVDRIGGVCIMIVLIKKLLERGMMK